MLPFFISFACITLPIATHHIHAEELIIQHRTVSEIRACFYDDDHRMTSKRGICVKSTPSSVQVRNLNGDIVVSQERKKSHDSLQLGSHKFIKYEGLKKFHRSISLSSEEDDGVIIDADNKDLERAAREILKDDHINLLEKMARSLGSEGIYGHEYQSILPFYSVAKRYSGLAKDLETKKRRRRGILRKIINNDEDSETDGLFVDKINNEEDMDEADMDQYQPDTQQSQDAPISMDKSLSEALGAQDDIGDTRNTTSHYSASCPPNPDMNCLGLCGYGCSCWHFVCGDCCWHLGCYQHDRCCRVSTWSWACLFPFSFSCDEKLSSYPECLDG